jgi:hypothetical protein
VAPGEILENAYSSSAVPVSRPQAYWELTKMTSRFSRIRRAVLAGMVLAAYALPAPFVMLGPAQAQTTPPPSPPPGVPINNPPVAPHSILVFNQRSFVSASGFGANDVVRIDVIHRLTSNVVSSLDVIPQDDPATPEFDGIVEVNHPGGSCWRGVTPDIRAGDRVRTTALNTVTGAVVIDETTVQDVKAGTPTDKAPDGTPLPAGTVQIHGTAQDFNSPGTPYRSARSSSAW